MSRMTPRRPRRAWPGAAGRGLAGRGPAAAARVVLAAAGRCLDHPDERLVGELPLLRAALAEHRGAPGVADLARLVDHLARTPLGRLQPEYVALFDLDRRHALHLTYWTDGDTRRRGEALRGFATRYRASGVAARTKGELPDHLPLVLDFAAHVDPAAGWQLLQEHRAALDLLRIALEENGTPYRDALRAVCATLPGPMPRTRTEVSALAGLDGPPGAEAVGLDPADPRLLPVRPVTTTGGAR